MMKDQPTVAEIAVALAAAMLGREKGCVAVAPAHDWRDSLQQRPK